MLRGKHFVIFILAIEFLNLSPSHGVSSESKHLPALSPFSHQFTARTTPFATTRTRSRKKRKTASFSDSIKAILYLRANIMRRTFPVLFKSAKRKLSLLLRQGDLIPSQKKLKRLLKFFSSTKSQKAEKHHRKQLFQ